MKVLSPSLALLLGLAPLGAKGRSQETTQAHPDGLQALRVAPFTPDGRMGNPAWKEAPVATGFTAQWPQFGKAAALPTEVRVLYDDRYLYVGARMQHPKGQAKVIRRVHRRDQESSSDWFGVYIDSLQDRRSALGFLVNAAGVQRDLLYYNDTSSDASWDGVWECAVSQDADGWTAELKIPLSLLRIRNDRGPQTWGINFSRSDQGPFRETSYWALAPRGVNAFVSHFPPLSGISGLEPRPRAEWIPYLSVQRKFETAQDFDDRKTTWHAGLDAHLGINSHSQLDLTVRPDFGQVEVDQAVLNLGTYETFFPEKRPFFLEGMELFQVPGPQLFYSRRIGQAAPGPDLGSGEQIIDRPLTTEITAAGKYTARFGNGLSLGLLGASVEPARAEVQRADGSREKREVYPLTNFGVLRLQQRLDDRGSYVGGMGTWMHQAGEGTREAQLQAFDTVYKSQDRSTLTELTLAHTNAGPKGELEEGHRERLRLNRQWRSGLWGELQLINASRWFNPNDMGYLNRADEQRFYATLGQRWDSPFGSLRNRELGLAFNLARDQAGRVYQRELSGWGRMDLSSFYSFFGDAGLAMHAEDDRELRTFTDPVKKYLQVKQIPWADLGFDTPGNRPWYVRVSVGRAWFEGGPSTDSHLYQSIKLNSALELQLESTFVRDEGERRYVDADPSSPAGTPPLVGLRRLSQFNQTLRLAYAFTPQLTVQFFSQWLAANWNNRDLKHYVDDWTLAPGLPNGVPTPETAFSDRLWNLNLITRWEFRPGSTAYLVYTHGAATDALINDRASLSPRNDLSVLRHLPSDDVVQVKLSWMFR